MLLDKYSVFWYAKKVEFDILNVILSKAKDLAERNTRILTDSRFLDKLGMTKYLLNQ